MPASSGSVPQLLGVPHSPTTLTDANALAPPPSPANFKPAAHGSVAPTPPVGLPAITGVTLGQQQPLAPRPSWPRATPQSGGLGQVAGSTHVVVHYYKSNQEPPLARPGPLTVSPFIQPASSRPPHSAPQPAPPQPTTPHSAPRRPLQRPRGAPRCPLQCPHGACRVLLSSLAQSTKSKQPAGAGGPLSNKPNTWARQQPHPRSPGGRG
jgi:hypothetical protein